MAVRLGPFDIQSQFATGGMGEIWRGTHIEQALPVAIKVITGANALMPEYQEEFRREVQAVARLNHPNVVQIFDYGTLPEEVKSLPGNLIPGSPYLVMEYASRGSLATQIDPLNWRDIKNILMSVLGGLSHAHACGLIHRDIKPGNVLLGSHHESPPRIILTDFGVAHAKDAHTRTDAMDFTSRSTEEASGTPRYMAPEQFMGKWRDYGPWTDLYAVGIMAYQLVTGELPFKGGTFMMLAMAHINNPMPALKPRIEVPKGFDEWVSRMTAKAPQDRFRSSADAVWALTQLDDSAILFGELSSVMGQDEDEFDDATDMMPTRVDFALPEALRIFTMSKTAQQQRYPDAPALPITWQEAEPPKAQNNLVGAGLGLFGLRTIPVVDRESTRTSLWEAFKRVYMDAKPEALVLRGLAGSGKTRLGNWLCEMLAEIGAAHVLQTTHGEINSPTHGLGWMLTSYFRSAGLNAEDMQARVSAELERFGTPDEYEVRALTEIMRSNMEESDRTSKFVQFTSPDQRYVVIRRVLSRLATTRPVVVFMDDAHFSWDSIEFARHVLDAEGENPIFFVLTVRDEALAERPEENEALSALLARPSSSSVSVDPLSRDHIRQLLQNHLGLPQALAHDVSGRSAGSPLFAVQLVEDWVKRGVLVEDNGALVVKHGETATVPRNLAAVWDSRIEFIVQIFARPGQVSDGKMRLGLEPDKVRQALEVAAALGHDVRLKEWEKVCEALDLTIPTGLINELVRLRLAVEQPNGFAFINNQLRDILVQSSADNDRWKSQNMNSAKALMSLYDPDTPGLAQRVGRHFVEGQAYQLAITCLEEAYQRAHGAPEQRDTAEIVDLLEMAYTSMGMSASDIRWAELWVRRGIPMVYSENEATFNHGISLLERAEELARESAKPTLLANILRAQAWASVYARRLEHGLTLAQEALELSQAKPHHAASCHRTLGHLHYHKGDIESARSEFEQTIELAPESVHAIWAHTQLGDCAIKEGRLEDARTILDNAIAKAREASISMAEAHALESLGILAYLQNDFENAEARFRESLQIRELLSGDSSLRSRSEELIARTLIARGEISTARPILERLHQRVLAGARSPFTHPADALAAVATAQSDESLFAQTIDAAFQFDRTPDHIELDMLRRLYEFSIQNYLEPSLVDRKFEQLAEIFDLPEEFKTQISELTQTIPSAPPMSESREILPEVQTLGHIEDSEPDDFEPVQMVNSDALNALAQSSSHFEAFDPDAWSEISDYESEASEASEVSEVEEEERP